MIILKSDIFCLERIWLLIKWRRTSISGSSSSGPNSTPDFPRVSLRVIKPSMYAHPSVTTFTTLLLRLRSMMMVSNSKSTDSSKSRNLCGEQVSDDLGLLTSKINQLKKQIQAERAVLIKGKVEKNREKLRSDVSELVSLAMDRSDGSSKENSGEGKMLSSRIKNPLCLLQVSGDDNSTTQEVAISISAKLPPADKIPPYTTWIFLDRNQRMADDQSVVGRRRIYYDQNGSEALICSDSEEEITEPEEEKHEFSEAENRIMRTICQDYEPSEEVVKILTQHIGGNTSEIYEACIMMKIEEEEEEEKVNGDVSASTDHRNISLDKSLSASLDSLDNLFCRRCLVFDCRLHGYSQTVITPTERQYCPPESQENAKPCSDHCYLHNTSSDEYLIAADPGKRKVSEETTTELEESKHNTNDQQESSPKKQKRLSVCMTIDDNLKDKSMDADVTKDDANSCGVPFSADSADVRKDRSTGVDMLKHESYAVETQINSSSINSEWKPLEKELYVKGLEIFGRNSCLISRNLLCGLKTCIQVANYMYDRGAETSRCILDGDEREDAAYPKEQETASRSRLLRRKGRTKKLKYSWKSAGHPSMWRRIADGKNQSCKQYIPCGCKSMCGKECPCLDNATCCEKYCGCSKSCKNRFRGCHCAKSQCRSRQCPCFAAGRECDPDVCRNCWVSCGDGSVGEPPRRGEGHCGNMRLLLRQQQRILLARSNVAGWGAFLKNSVNRNDYLGEYTGELISHREADKRGKIYDRANSSFLFDLNDQYVLDAYRKGDKLKFANHSSNPNCYAKVMMVGGDHRVGIFARERIEAGEELFYDYRYGPDQAPAWARKPDDLLLPQARPKKH
ncbi:hypothetical protein L1887_13339 [Cichorium endivia]|nr:hypothetical protein L1887_13339 [Cichorium endivia]